MRGIFFRVTSIFLTERVSKQTSIFLDFPRFHNLEDLAIPRIVRTD